MRNQDGTDEMGELELRRLAFDLIPQLPSNATDACKVVDYMRHLLVTHLGADGDGARPSDEDGPLLRVVGGRSTSMRGG